MRYVNNKLTLSESERKDARESINVLWQDQLSRDDYKADMLAYKGYVVIRDIAIQMMIIDENEYPAYKPKKAT